MEWPDVSQWLDQWWPVIVFPAIVSYAITLMRKIDEANERLRSWPQISCGCGSALKAKIPRSTERLTIDPGHRAASVEAGSGDFMWCGTPRWAKHGTLRPPRNRRLIRRGTVAWSPGPNIDRAAFSSTVMEPCLPILLLIAGPRWTCERLSHRP